MDSDDSEFYGDEDTISSLKARVDDFDIAAWWSQAHHKRKYSAQPLATLTDRLTLAAITDRLYNRRGGEERLALLSHFQEMARGSGMPLSVVQMERWEAERDLRQLAVACELITGKWMLFLAPEEVDEVWERVARATAQNRLGIGAKVEIAGGAETGKARLLCVYTRDFRDKRDVARVLDVLRQLQLVMLGGEQIYYKSGFCSPFLIDAWTELGIYGGNSWGIRASMYSSNEIFSFVKSLDQEAL
ncbi:DUF1917-domain-containing protein [Canariomyces notabilis]|uniref:DUF1917-domain-containing protein n=1 Tax=Canariomyces notabilis TaxID=2074819 RepID=A0AAN6T7L7_9PEZI|nr:DUF1917-domain-containing protein [Canariomyces arenarius]